MARPKKAISEVQVLRLAKIHCTNGEIASIFGVSVDTIERRFAGILHKGREEGRTRLRRKQFTVAMKGNVAMLIWLGKQVLGQKDKQELNHTGADGGPIDIKHEFDENRFAELYRNRILRSRGIATGGGETPQNGEGKPVHPGSSN